MFCLVLMAICFDAVFQRFFSNGSMVFVLVPAVFQWSNVSAIGPW